jgi:hypothetical protein
VAPKEHAEVRIQRLAHALDKAAAQLAEADAVEKAADEVVEVAYRKGAIYVTDEETGSDKLVGFFVPVGAMNRLGKALLK